MKDSNQKTSEGNKYIYYLISEIIMTLIVAAVFFHYWRGFVSVNNKTGSLLGIGNLGMAVGIYVFLYLLIGRWLHAFRIGDERIASILAGQVLTILLVDFLECFISCAITGEFRFFPPFLLMYTIAFGFQTIIICIASYVSIRFFRKLFSPIKVIEVHGNYHNHVVDKVNEVYYKYSVMERISIDESDDIIREQINKYDMVLLNDIPSQKRNELLKICFDMDKSVIYVPKISDILVKNADELNVIDSPLFLSHNVEINIWQQVLKRLFDIVASVIALTILSPFLLITAIAIHLEDGGPVIYKQERVTIGGKRFMIIKFRSMIVDAEKECGPRLSSIKDDRITKVGRLIRAIRFDELPQLINIIKGDMSIVGPRPERAEIIEEYCKYIPEFEFRTKIRGGLTGYAQVYGKYNTTSLDKLKLDMMYITNFSLLLDLQIIFETVKILIRKESTEGVKIEEKTNDDIYN